MLGFLKKGDGEGKRKPVEGRDGVAHRLIGVAWFEAQKLRTLEHYD